MSSLAFCDDYGGVLCRSHGDGIPSVMTSRVCEKPSTCIVPIPLYAHIRTSTGAQLSYCLPSLRPILGSAVACKNGYSYFDNVAETRYDLLTDEADPSGDLFGRWRRHRL